MKIRLKGKRSRVKGQELKVISQRLKAEDLKTSKFYIFWLLLLLFTFYFSLLTVDCFAARRSVDESTTIDSETLDYDGETFTYTARGQVKIKRGVANVEAEEMKYNEQTSDLTAEGNVIYEDSDVKITAKRAELNLDFNTGVLYEAEVYSKKDNYHIRGKKIERVGEKEYTLKDASFTT